MRRWGAGDSVRFIAKIGQYAVGCQKEIATQILAAEADYVLALK